MTGFLTAGLYFTSTIIHPSPSVFHADQRGVEDFPEIRLYTALEPSPLPWGIPTSARPGTDFTAYFTEEIMLGILKLVI